jgi:SAM-dependent methyltransferase
VLRQIQSSFASAWEAFEESGLAGRLIERGLLLPWEDAPLSAAADASAWRVIRPEPVGFISYPYEWTFGQLRDAALVTLDAQLEAVDAGMTLRDASAYNVQFRGVRPVLMDSLSFEPLEPDAPWVAYRQCCEHFLAPLALMAHRDVRLADLLRANLEGIPLDLASRLLGGSSRLRLGLASHLHLHARAQRQHAGGGDGGGRQVRLPRSRLRALVESLRATIAGLSWEPAGTEWADYAENTSYDEAATASKERLVERLLDAAIGQVVWDLGANTGRYSAIAAGLGRRVLAFDIDPAAAERHYRALRRDGRTDTTPLVMDLADPSPSLGWANRERRSLAERSDADVLLALALVHHLAIGRNVPLPMIADELARYGAGLVIEWVPKPDPMVQRLLASRRDIFPDYTLDGFRAAFAERWEIQEEAPIEHSSRVLFRMRRRGGTVAGPQVPG